MSSSQLDHAVVSLSSPLPEITQRHRCAQDEVVQEVRCLVESVNNRTFLSMCRLRDMSGKIADEVTILPSYRVWSLVDEYVVNGSSKPAMSAARKLSKKLKLFGFESHISKPKPLPGSDELRYQVWANLRDKELANVLRDRSQAGATCHKAAVDRSTFNSGSSGTILGAICEWLHSFTMSGHNQG